MPAISLIGLIAAVLLWGAALNGFPLVFPDSGTYLRVAYGREWPIDRSGFYGLALKPLLLELPPLMGLWVAVALQAAAIGGVLLLATRTLVHNALPAHLIFLFAAVGLGTSLPWHAGQLMPDAFTGIVVLLAWLAASRDPTAPGGPLLWFAAFAAALMHLTHLPLLAVAAAAAILGQAIAGLAWRKVLRRGAAALLVTGLAAATQVAANGFFFDRPVLTPAGPVFLFARLNEDGLVPRWLERHCGRDASPQLCAIRGDLPRDSQALLWGDGSPVADLIWIVPEEADRWPWIDRMSEANRGAIAEQPGAFLAASARGAGSQLVHFTALDDECPEVCTRFDAALADALRDYRPGLLSSFFSSAQARGTLPKDAVRAVTTPVTAIALVLLFPALVLAWRRRDGPVLSLALALLAAILANAVLAGALSDVHDRYQSRIVWLAPFLIISVALRWRAATKQ